MIRASVRLFFIPLGMLFFLAIDAAEWCASALKRRKRRNVP